VSKLGIVRQIDVERGEFGLIVGVIARELFSLTDLLARREALDCGLLLVASGVHAFPSVFLKSGPSFTFSINHLVMSRALPVT
jgi:hypothetical protein